MCSDRANAYERCASTFKCYSLHCGRHGGPAGHCDPRPAMFTTCIHCNQHLGANEAFESFPVGKRLAFDAAQGRLWVVCTGCGRWNLSPLDERWETIEAAERRFRDSRLRVSTDNVGLARLREGVDLIRIGSPQRPEMAAWRYGDQFGKRRKRQMLITGAVLGSTTAIVGGIIVAGASVGSFTGIWANPGIRDMLVHGLPYTVVARIPLADGRVVPVKRKDARAAVMEREVDSDQFAISFKAAGTSHLVVGDEAMRVAAKLMPTVNRFGGSAREVQSAVELLEEVGDPLQVLRTVQKRFGGSAEANRKVPWFMKNVSTSVHHARGSLKLLAPRDRLALEMALHEESERRAMDGELAQLEAAWREAEEIASISDTMFVLPSVAAQFQELRQRTRDGEPGPLAGDDDARSTTR